MTTSKAGFTSRMVRVPTRGERVASFVEDYLACHPGLTVGELAFRIRADKRDLHRLIRDRSVGHALEDALAVYFGRIFGEAIFGNLWGRGPSCRERHLANELAEIAASRGRLEALRNDDASAAGVRRLGDGGKRHAAVPRRGQPGDLGANVSAAGA